MLNNFDKNYLIKQFPRLEVSYVKHIHNTTKSDFYMLIPKGKKYFAWFTQLRGNNICVFMDFNGKYITNCIVYNVSCCSTLFYGTILYGTIIKNTNQPFFIVEDIYQYQYKTIIQSPWEKKLSIIHKIFQNQIKQISYNKHFILFSLPVMDTDYQKICQIIPSLPYQIYSIMHLFSKKTLKLQQKNIIQEAIFHVEPNINNDIYDLYCMKENKLYLYDTALINDYKSSVLMNKLFRNIKENLNLDALEESDSDDDFENIDENKYILKKSYTMTCIYLPQFNKWTPKSVSETNNIVLWDSIQGLKKKY